MKKSKIIIAVFAVVMGTVSSGSAEDIKVDFDGKNSSPLFAQLATQARESSLEAAVEATLERVPAEDFFNPRMMSVLDASIKSAIDYSEAHGDEVLKTAFTEFLARATPQQKYDFVYGAARVYHMPRFSANKGVAQWVCEAITKTVCKTVCDPGCVQDCQDIIVDSCKWM
ncbi:MAG TPA: hypothetical protein DCS63_04395 [Elusimicrobia bacterium]|nr:hypothetical protein [Elusimicrobiota bacterium]